jgi:hypothetical protein
MPAKLAVVHEPLPAAMHRSGAACANAPITKSAARWQVLVRH